MNIHFCHCFLKSCSDWCISGVTSLGITSENVIVCSGNSSEMDSTLGTLWIVWNCSLNGNVLFCQIVESLMFLGWEQVLWQVSTFVDNTFKGSSFFLSGLVCWVLLPFFFAFDLLVLHLLKVSCPMWFISDNLKPNATTVVVSLPGIFP